jgi:cytochrome c2
MGVKAMTASGMTWNEQTVEAFLTEPTRVLPGTTMSARLPREWPLRLS